MTLEVFPDRYPFKIRQSTIWINQTYNNKENRKKKRSNNSQDYLLYVHQAMRVRLVSVRQFYSIHYENMPIQIYWKFYPQKMKIFR